MDLRNQSEIFDLMLQRLTSRYIALWEDAPEDIPEFSVRFSSRQQSENERRLGSQLQGAPSSLKTYESMTEADRVQLHARVKRTILGLPFFPDDVLSEKFFEDSEVVTGSFIRAAREFDPSISENDILQALRNLWVFNSIQAIFGQPISLTRSSLAYSLLYPFTDNGLDTNTRTEGEKSAFLHWLNHWFEGFDSEALDDWTAKVARLLDMIEGEYPRSVYPSVYQSLLAIHNAQRKSLLLRGSFPYADEASLLAITVEKGGTSVLVDGYLASPELSSSRADVLFGYGMLLQLLDDLQDLEEDRIAGYSTPFLRALGRSRLEEITCRLIHFTRTWAQVLKKQVSPRNAWVQRVIEGSCTFLIAEAVGRHRELYTKTFLKVLERSTPLRLEYLAEVQQNLRERQVREPKLSMGERVFAGQEI